MVGAGLRVAGLVLNPLTLAVLAPVPRLRVGALPVGELHPSPAGPGAAPPGSPQAPAAVHNHLQRTSEAGRGRKKHSGAVGQSSVPKANRSLGSLGLRPQPAGTPRLQAKSVLKFGTRPPSASAHIPATCVTHCCRKLPRFSPQTQIENACRLANVVVPSRGFNESG